ncbi:putative RNA-directed DNA polymerase [Helianthus annuus]|nr:putative RNA-directed DNA polymerase [Helianthus annuus]
MNTAFFHSSLKTRNHRSRIDVIKDSSGVMFEGENVQLALVQHYEKFLGCQGDISLFPSAELFGNSLDPVVANHMVRQVTTDEVRKAMFSIGADKAPGPDGYTSAFFKGAWSVIGEEVSNAIIDFFSTGKLLRELNHTLIVLVPKIATPFNVTDYRPIACCNVLYKCISKILADRLKVALNMIVNVNQSAFVPGRKISDNILLTQELMHNYHRNVGPPRCAFKVDIQKAYDTVDWRFLRSVLLGFGFDIKMVDWIMICVSTPSYSICVNGNVHGYFRGKRGLRQGDPISPYLFTLVMEILTGILHHETRMNTSFRFHNRCEKQQIINLCFADDLFLFARGDVGSAKCIMAALSKFTNMSGLFPSVQKSTIFFCNVPQHVKNAILNVMPFVEGSLPARYLGVPLISTRLLYKDCSVLVERLEKRISNWKNKLLSFTGRVQLILAVLSSMHIYWSSVFILPSRVTHELEARMRNFLWSQDSSFQKGRAKVS